MRDYELRRGHWKNIEGEKLRHLIQDVFQEDPRTEGNGLVLENWGALKRLYVEPLGKTHLRVDSATDPKAPMEDAQRTMRAWNEFLELATGYDVKERKKRAEKEAKAAAAEIPEV